MEESLVLDVGQARMMQEITEHECAWLVLHTRLLEELLRCATSVAALTATIGVVIVIKVRVLVHVFISILLVGNGVLSCLLVKMTLHEDVEEVGYCRVISQLTVNINCPEVWMTRRVFRVREAQQIDSHMADYILLIKCTTY